MISRTPDQRRHYDARLKWEFDENTRIQTAFEEGEAKGEARVRVELIRTLEELLQMQVSSDAELQSKSLEELQERAQFLREMIRKRPGDRSGVAQAARCVDYTAQCHRNV
jgi:hypothetical protein